MKSLKLHPLYCWFAFLFILLWMTSCSTRKVLKTNDQKEQVTQTNILQKSELKIERDINVQVQTEAIANGKSITEKTTYTPINPNITSSFTDDNGQKKELNNASYTKEKTITKTTKKEVTKATKKTKKNLVDKNSFKDKTKFKAKDKTQIKQKDRTSFSWWFLLLLILPFAFYTYWKLKKN